MSDLQKLSGFNSHSYKTPQIKASQTSVSLVRNAMNTFKSGVEAESFVIRYSWFLPFFTHGFMIHSHRRTGNFLPRGAVNHLPKKFVQVAQIFTKQSKRNEGHTMQQHRPYWHMKVAWYSFSGSIPAKFEHKLRRHKQSFGKIATAVVLDKDENLLWSGLQWHWSCHSNKMTPLPIIHAAIFLSGNCSNKIVHRRFSVQ